MDKIELKIQYYENLIDQDWIKNFVNNLAKSNISVKLEKRELSSAYAAYEWVLPAVIALWFVKPFFESFFEEAGKDAYKEFKKGLKYLAKKIRGIGLTYTDPNGKITSRVHELSIHIKMKPNIVLKFLFSPLTDLDRYDEMIDNIYAFLNSEELIQFLKDFDSGFLLESKFGIELTRRLPELLKQCQPVEQFVKYDEKLRRWQVKNLTEEMEKK